MSEPAERHATIAPTPEEHMRRHQELHRALDELMACYLSQPVRPGKRTSIHDSIYELMKFSARLKESTEAPR